jgi:hypothetical protein
LAQESRMGHRVHAIGERGVRSCVRRLPNEGKRLRLKPIRVTARRGIEQSRALLHLVNTWRFAKQSVVL